jgi:hypothetical protein
VRLLCRKCSTVARMSCEPMALVAFRSLNTDTAKRKAAQGRLQFKLDHPVGTAAISIPIRKGVLDRHTREMSQKPGRRTCSAERNNRNRRSGHLRQHKIGRCHSCHRSNHCQRNNHLRSIRRNRIREHFQQPGPRQTLGLDRTRGDTRRQQIVRRHARQSCCRR